MRTLLPIVTALLLAAVSADASKTHPRMNEARDLLRTAATSPDPLKTLREVLGLLKPAGKKKNRAQAIKHVEEAMAHFQAKRYADANKAVASALSELEKAIAAD